MRIRRPCPPGDPNVHARCRCAARARSSSEDSQELHLLVGRSLVINSPTRIKRISLADPTIAEAVVINPNEVLLNGKAPGGVSLLLWDENDQSQTFEISVGIDAVSLAQKIHSVFPNEAVQVDTSNDVVMLSGRVSSTAVADKIVEVAKGISPNVTSVMQVPAPSLTQVSARGQICRGGPHQTQSAGFQLPAEFWHEHAVFSVSTQQYSPFGITQSTTSTPSGSANSSSAE